MKIGNDRNVTGLKNFQLLVAYQIRFPINQLQEEYVFAIFFNQFDEIVHYVKCPNNNWISRKQFKNEFQVSNLPKPSLDKNISKNILYL